MTGLAKPTMSIHPMASPTFCLVSIEVSSLTVTSDCSCLVIIIILFLPDGRDRNRKSPKPHHFQPPNSTHIWTLIRQCAVRVLVLIRITVLDLEPNPDFQTFLIISETYHQIFKCNTSKRRSGQELLFIFFELRAPTCL